jgi:hypothetical protein
MAPSQRAGKMIGSLGKNRIGTSVIRTSKNYFSAHFSDLRFRTH